jgi:hypothetical protein
MATKLSKRIASLNIPETTGVQIYSGPVNAVYLKINNEFTEKNYTIPDGVTVISDGAFYKCGCIEEIIIPASVTRIGDHAFADCHNLTTVTILSANNHAYSLTMGDDSFNGCFNLTKINIPEGTKEIGAHSFNECYLLESIDLPKSLTKVREYLFYRCKNLTTVKLNEGLKQIHDFAFYMCLKLNNVTLPISLQFIGRNAFNLCVRLESINIEKNLLFIGDNVFSLCYDLQSFKVDSANPVFETVDGYALVNKHTNSFIQYPIKSEYLNNNKNEYVMPENIKVICSNAFRSCKTLNTIDIKNVSEIQDCAFSYCKNLVNIYNNTENFESVIKGNNIFFKTKFAKTLVQK